MESEITLSPEVLVRRATLGDAPAVATILRKAFADYRDLYTDAGFAATTPTIDQIKTRMAEGPVWIASVDGRAVGTAAAVMQPDAVYVRGMAVLPESRGLRLGELLLNAVCELALAEGFRKLRLSTTPFLARAIKLYERYGFAFTPEGPGDLFGTPLRTMEMRVGDP